MKKEIPIFFAVDENYAPFLAVTLRSIIDHFNRDYHYVVYILTSDLTDYTFKRLAKMEDPDCEIKFVNIQEQLKKIGGKLFTRDYYTNATYYRIFIQNLFPQYDKVLYLDCDILVLGDISELYNIDLGDNYVGAITEDIMTNIDVFGRYVEEFLGIERHKFFNAGVLVLNLKKYREVDVEKQFLKLLGQYKFRVTQDEDYLNVICKDHVKFIEQGWNKSPIEDPTFDPSTLKLVHYKINYKPWHFDNVKFAEDYWDFVKRTEFYEDILKIKAAYSEEDRKRDEDNYVNLVKLAESEIAREDGYYKMLKKKQLK